MNRSCVAFACVAVISTFASSANAQGTVACSLLTPPEVTQALGVTVLPGHQMGSGSTNVCIFAPTPKFGMGERQIAVTIVSPAMFDVTRQPHGLSVITPATVPGAEAYFQTIGTVTTIHVKKNGKSFQVRMNPRRDGHETAPQLQAIESALAVKAAARV